VGLFDKLFRFQYPSFLPRLENREESSHRQRKQEKEVKTLKRKKIRRWKQREFVGEVAKEVLLLFFEMKQRDEIGSVDLELR
jgi:hypothetical protein